MQWLLLLALLAFFFYRFRKSAEWHFPLVLFKTKRAVERMWRVGRKHKKMFNIFGDLAILLALVAMPATFYLIGRSAYDVVTIEGMKSPIAPVVPGVRLPGTDVFIPLWQGLIAMLILGSVHEFAHGVVAAAQNTKPKSVVLIFITILASFGVELDEKEVNALGTRKKLRIFAAGSFANLVTAVVFAVLLLGLAKASAPLLQPVGMRIVEVAFDTPASGVLEVGDLVLELNGTKADDFASFVNASLRMRPNETMTVKTQRGVFELVATPDPEAPERGRIGIVSSVEFEESKRPLISVVVWLSQLFNWVVGLNLSVGFLNLLPLPPFDGGRIFAILSDKYGRSGLTKIVYALTFSFLMVNIFGGFVKGL